MSNTYTQIFIHFIFAVKGRESILNSERRTSLYKYFNTIINSEKQKLVAVNGYKDHIHLLVSLNPEQSPSSLIKFVKINSSKFIKEELKINNFSWQSGYGAFSYSKSQLTKIIDYIDNQEEHHKIKSFQEEYENFLKVYEIPYNPKYVFQYLDNLESE